MAVKKTTKSPTEADFEAEVHRALRVAFPWLPDGSIQHQTTFSFAFGGKRITVDGTRRNAAQARADILVYWNQRPLAVLELKRAGVALDTDDENQGLSYARVLHPRPPLVVVTNGADVRLLETHTGEEWNPDDRSQESLADLLKAASRVATHDLKSAVSTLMGSNPEIWAQAVWQMSKENLADSSGDWSDALLPFVPGFLIPRQATQTVLQKLRDGQRLVLVEGPPLIGKSNVLRELIQQTEGADDLVTFFVETDAGAGVLQQLADALAQALNWPVNKDECRNWLLRLSNSGGPALVLAVDGVGLSRDDFRKDVEDLSSQAFGPSVRLVLALDDTVADRLVVNSTGRKASAIGRRAVRVPLVRLDDSEFTAATRVLWDHRAGVMHGGQVSHELRLPWVLRAVMSEIVLRPQYADEKLAASIPPLLGLDLIGHTRTRFTDDELRRLFRGTAQAVISDSQDRKRPISLILESIAVYVVRRETLRRFLDYAEVELLIERGCLRPVIHDSGAPILVVRIPELLASEAADLLAVELVQRAQIDADNAAEWLSNAAGGLPLGDIVAAQALLDAAMRHGSLPFNLITALINSPPREEAVRPGTKVAMHVPGAGVMDMTFREQGVVEIESGGQRHLITPDPGDEEHVTYTSFNSWLILSYLGGCTFALENEERQLGRVDPAVLLEVGACPIVLRRPGPDANQSGILTHHIPGHGAIVCHKAGIVEPITQSILRFLSSEGEGAEQWIEEAVSRNSLPLLARIDIALRQLLDSADAHRSEFARRVLDDVIRPAKSALPALH